MADKEKPAAPSDALLNKALRFTNGKPDCALVQWGLEVKAGWYPIIEKLLDDLEAYCVLNGLPLPKIYQIKQKMASLRVRWIVGRDGYSESAQTAIDRLIDQAEQEADQCCEICGKKPATPVWDHAWLLRLCGVHAQVRSPRKQSDRPPVWQMLKVGKDTKV